MSAQQPTEEEMRAALEEEIKHVRMEDMLLQSVVSLVNLGARRAGVTPEFESERDPEQVRIAVEAVRALMPLVQQVAPEQAPAVQDALSQLQLAYVQAGGGQGAGSPRRERGRPPRRRRRASPRAPRGARAGCGSLGSSRQGRRVPSLTGGRGRGSTAACAPLTSRGLMLLRRRSGCLPSPLRPPFDEWPQPGG